MPVDGEASDLKEKLGDGLSPSEAHEGGWAGLSLDGGEPVAVTDLSFIIHCHGDRDTSQKF